MRLTKLFKEFTENEQASGLVLMFCTIVSILLANSPFGKEYLDFWHAKIGFETGSIALKYSVEHWINDGLMAIFFLLIGLEIERELYIGELSSFKKASLPIFAALGGMLVPALFHFMFNYGTPTQKGFGIPMATDIAFVLGMLALLKDKVPTSLKIFLTALAIVDDLGAILVIAIFYVSDFSFTYLMLSFVVFGFLLLLNRMGVTRLVFYIIPGVFMWYFMLKSGVHATLAGVLLAFAIPFGDGSKSSISYKLQHNLHVPVAFGIVPLFALANTGIVFAGDWLAGLASSNVLGIFSGLFLGKPIGISLFSFAAIALGISKLPPQVRRRHIVGAGFLAGIGFTMSTFITLLAFKDAEVIQSAKLGILLTSLLAGIVGFAIFHGIDASSAKKAEKETDE